MSHDNEGASLEKRFLLPYWHQFAHAVRDSRALLPVAPKRMAAATVVPDDVIAQRVTEWENARTHAHAADLIALSLSIGNPGIAREAAEFVLKDSSRLLDSVRDGAEGILHPDQQSIPRFPHGGNLADHAAQPRHAAASPLAEHIREIKNRLRIFPESPYYWIELARAHVASGHHRKAERAAKTALSLAPHDRFIIRCTARMLVDKAEHGEALSLLHKNKDMVIKDPWLLATEIAISQMSGEKPRFMKKGMDIIKDAGKYAPFHLSELSASIATQESFWGKHRKAESLFARAADAPNDNVGAQLAWAVKVSLAHPDTLKKAMSHGTKVPEAEYIFYRQQLAWDKALMSADKWRRAHPYSQFAAIHASYVASALAEDFDKARKICEESPLQVGDNSVPRNILLNNLAYAYLRQGDAVNAKKVLMRTKGERRGAIIATNGMLCYRMGDVAEGEKKYQEAVDFFKNDDVMLASAYLNWARESRLVNSPKWENQLALAKKHAKKARNESGTFSTELLKQVDRSEKRAKQHNKEL